MNKKKYFPHPRARAEGEWAAAMPTAAQVAYLPQLIGRVQGGSGLCQQNL